MGIVLNIKSKQEKIEQLQNAVDPSFRSELMNLNSVIQRSFTAFSVTDVLTVIPRFDLLLLFNGRLLCLLLNLSSNASII